MKFLLPDIDDLRSAHKACGGAAGVAFFVTAVTGLVVWLQTSGKVDLFPGMGKEAYLDAGIFFAIGVGLCFHSRIAAVAGLLIYIAERVFMVITYGVNPGQVVMLVLFGAAFLNGVRGAFAWHAYRKAEKQEALVSPGSILETAAPARPKINFVRPLILLLVFAIVLAGAFFYFKSNSEASKLYDGLSQKVKSTTATSVSKLKKTVPQAAFTAPQGPAVKLMLKSGREFEGVLVKKSPEGTWLFIEGTGEVFFSAREIAKES